MLTLFPPHYLQGSRGSHYPLFNHVHAMCMLGGVVYALEGSKPVGSCCQLWCLHLASVCMVCALSSVYVCWCVCMYVCLSCVCAYICRCVSMYLSMHRADCMRWHMSLCPSMHRTECMCVGVCLCICPCRRLSVSQILSLVPGHALLPSPHFSSCLYGQDPFRLLLVLLLG